MAIRKDALTREERQRAGAVFETHQRFIESVAVQHAQTRDQVPDIVQAVGLRVCLGLNGFRSESEITSWLYRVTVNAARNHYRDDQRQRRAVNQLGAGDNEDRSVGRHGYGMDPIDETTQTFQDTGETAEDAMIRQQRVEAVREGIGALRPQHRAAICHELRSYSVLSAERIAATERERQARHRARKQLKTLLADDPRLES